MNTVNKSFLLFNTIFIVAQYCQAQNFIRSELPTSLSTPWEIVYGQDGFLWLTEAEGNVSRVDPVSGNKAIVYTASDYFGGSPLEQLPLCHQPDIGSGTLGLTLHPDFGTAGNNFIYFVYSYNQGTINVPETKFKIRRLTWDASLQAVTGDSDIVMNLANGYDHLGGRLLAVKRNGINYLYFTAGDNGISEVNDPACYSPQSTNPNNFAQDPSYLNGKIHRFHMDGSIPIDNPIPGNPFYTRGHRNPQGLMYNAIEDILYDVEHGDRTDDEINILHAGMNYGWKYVRGYHGDNNIAGEDSFIQNYIPHSLIANDSLVPALFSWCDVPQPTTGAYLDWCTPAPSDGIYYSSSGIPQWTNSLLVVTLKNGASTDRSVYQFKLNPDGKSLAPTLPNDTNPKLFFGNDQLLNGRLRDIAVSPGGTTIYLINNSGAPTDKITVYTYTGPSGIDTPIDVSAITLYPNPVKDELTISGSSDWSEINIVGIDGRKSQVKINPENKIDVQSLLSGIYFLELQSKKGESIRKKFVKN